MNKNIERLMHQADEQDVTTSHYNTDYLCDIDPERVEIFAKLIIDECIQAVDNVGGFNEEFHMNAIAEHFGIE